MNKGKIVKAGMTILVSCLLVLALLAGACTTPTAGTKPTVAQAPAPKGKVYKIRYSGPLPVTSQTSKEMIAFGKMVTERTEGRVQVETYVSKELYDSFESIDAIKAGSIEMMNCGITIWSGWNPFFEFANIFFLLASAAQFKKTRDALTTFLDPLYQEHNAKIVNYYYYGNTGIGSKKRIEKVSDIKGLKIRGTGIACNENLKVLGAVPVRMDSSDVYDALGKKAIDGSVSGWDTLANRKWYEVAEYFVGHFYFSPYAGWINLQTWNSLPKDLQDIIIKAGQEIEAASYAANADAEKGFIDVLSKKGSVHIFTSEELREWTAAVAPIIDSWVKKCAEKGLGDKAQQVIKILKESQ